LDFPRFLDVDEADEPAFVIVPIPFDGTSTYRKGADMGPEALLRASAQVELYDIETDSEAYRTGIRLREIAADFSSAEAMVASVRRAYRAIFAEPAFPLGIGGEHSVSAGIIEAAAERVPDLTVVQFDAHADLRNEYEGSRYNHACVMARAAEVCSIFQVGIRSMDRSEWERMDRSRVIFASEIAEASDWRGRLRDAVHGAVYITVDLDALDPSIMGATGTPEPGGMGWYDLLAGLRIVFEQATVVGADIVELCPNGNHGAEFTAAKLAYKIITYQQVFGGSHG